MLFSLAGNLSVSLFSTYLNWLYMIYSFSIFGASQINKLNKSMERFLNFPQCVSVLDQLDVRGNFTDLGRQACEVFLGLFHKYWDPDKPFFRFNSYSFISPTHFIEIWRQSVSMDARYENKLHKVWRSCTNISSNLNSQLPWTLTNDVEERKQKKSR